MKNTESKNYLYGFIKSILALVVLTGAGQAATFTVTNTNDLDGFGLPASGSLRKAIVDANNSNDAVRVINFNIVNAGGTVKTITPQSALPVINVGDAFLTIDATTQSGYTNTPVVQLVGVSVPSGSGFMIGTGKVTIKGFAIRNFPGYGISVNCSQQGVYQCSQALNYVIPTGVNVYGNHIGTDATGSIDYGNGAGGIYISYNYNVESNIGGGLAGQRNIISGNGGHGIYFANAQETIRINNNYIGTTWNGNAALGNDGDGIYAASFRGIIGTTTAQRNVISGNAGNGITNADSGVEIKGNYIGTNAAGTNAIGNQNGIVCQNAACEIGGTAAGEGNTISGNDGLGIKTQNAWTEIRGNFIGTTPSGSLAIANGSHGIQLGDYSNIRGNTISGNGGDGVYVGNSGSGARVFDNYIGTNANGVSIGNGGNGIRIVHTAESILIGDEDDAGNNVIAFNAGDGIYLPSGFGGTGGAQRVQIRINSIYSNGGLGIDLGPTNGVTTNDLNDADEGPNDLQNFPIIGKASPNLISGSLNSLHYADFFIDFYRVDSCDASGNGEGRYYLGSSLLLKNGSSNLNFDLTGYNLAVGQIVVATATQRYYESDFPNNGGHYEYRTSEFSPCVTVTAPAGDFTLAAATVAATENGGAVTVTVNRTGGSNGTATVNFQATDGTATAGQDYAATSGTLSFLPAQTSKTFTIPITNDTRDEPDETVNIALVNPSPGSLVVAPATAVLTITDNDNPPTVSVNDVSILEGNDNLTAFTFNVSLSEASGFASSVNWATANVTATAGVDYQTNSGTVNFAAGETTKQITVQVVGELLVELNETFSVNLSAPTLLTIGDGSGVGTILDDDNPGKFSFTLAPYNAAENAGAKNATVIRTNGSAGTATVDIATVSGGTATAGQDYTATAGTLVFLDGETAKVFPVTILDDQTTEQTETINLALSNPTGGTTIQTGTAVINILDNDNGYESDVAPRPTGTGNGTVTTDDFTQIGKFVAGVDQVDTTTNEFQRADIAPRAAKGNGALTIADYVQAGRYAAGYDPTQTAGGASGPSSFNFDEDGRLTEESAAMLLSDAQKLENAQASEAANLAARVVSVVNANGSAGQPVSVTIEVDASGSENGFGFTLNYDAAKLSAPVVSLGTGAANATLVTNTLQAGQVGVVLALPAGQTVIAGKHALVTVTFTVAPNAPDGTTSLSFTDTTVMREVVDANAGTLPTTFTGGAVTILGPTAGGVSLSGQVTTNSGRGASGARISITDASGVTRYAAVSRTGRYRFDDLAAGETYIVSVSQKGVQFNPSTLVVTILEDMENVDFLGSN